MCETQSAIYKTLQYTTEFDNALWRSLCIHSVTPCHLALPVNYCHMSVFCVCVCGVCVCVCMWLVSLSCSACEPVSHSCISPPCSNRVALSHTLVSVAGGGRGSDHEGEAEAGRDAAQEPWQQKGTELFATQVATGESEEVLYRALCYTGSS